MYRYDLYWIVDPDNNKKELVAYPREDLEPGKLYERAKDSDIALVDLFDYIDNELSRTPGYQTVIGHVSEWTQPYIEKWGDQKTRDVLVEVLRIYGPLGMFIDADIV